MIIVIVVLSIIICVSGLANFFLFYKKKSLENYCTVLSQKNNKLKSENNKIIQYFHSKFMTLGFSDDSVSSKKMIDEFIDKIKLDLCHSEEKIKCFDADNQEIYLTLKIISMFLENVIDNIMEFSQPLSEVIFKLKKEISDFLKQNDAVRSQVTGEFSEYSFERIMRTYQDNFFILEKTETYLKNNIEEILKSMDLSTDYITNICETSESIQKIAEKINLLSINAGIVSARNGGDGFGFKVIASEIKQLSGSTSKFVNNISSEVEDSYKLQNQIQNLICEFETSSNSQVNTLRENHESLYEKLEKYYKSLLMLNDNINNVVTNINTHIEHLNPLFHTHDIIVQQLRNVNGFIEGLLEKIGETNISDSVIKEFISKVDNTIKTTQEFQIYKTFCSEYHIDIYEKSEDNIVLFKEPV